MTGSFLGAPWFYWSVGIAIGLPLALIGLTEWQHTLRRRRSALIGPVSLLRNYLLPLGALLMAMIGATQMPAGSTPVRIVGTLVAVVVLILMLSGISKVSGIQYGKDDEMVPVNEFVEKPVDPKTLVAKVKKLLSGKEN